MGDDSQQGTARREPTRELDELAYQIIGACIEVHRELGPGLPESCYEHALTIELANRGIHCVQQPVFPVFYKGRQVGTTRIDLFADGQLVIEIKAVESLEPVHVKQVTTYLRVTESHLGLLVNFDVAVLKSGGIKRVVLGDT
jgi:GxxExxY protein